MTLADHIAADTQRFDAVETLTVSQVRDGTTTADDVENCLPTALSRDELASIAGSFLESTTRAYSIPAANLTAASLDGMATGDTLTDGDGVIYRVTSQRLMSLGARWRVVCSVLPTEA